MKFKIYDYDNKASVVEIPDKPIDYIHVIVLSGDETGIVYFKDGTTQSFDASDCRDMSFFDGEYDVLGKVVDEWISTDSRLSKRETKSYQRASIWIKLTHCKDTAQKYGRG